MAAQRTNNFNIARNQYARRSRSDPYPKFEDVYRRSDTFNHADGFTDLYVRDFVYTHARIACRRLQTLELTEAERQLSLGTKASVPGGNTANTLKGNGQST